MLQSQQIPLSPRAGTAKTGENERSASHVASLLAPTFPAHQSAAHLSVFPSHGTPLERQTAQKKKKKEKKERQMSFRQL